MPAFRPRVAVVLGGIVVVVLAVAGVALWMPATQSSTPRMLGSETGDREPAAAPGGSGDERVAGLPAAGAGTTAPSESLVPDDPLGAEYNGWAAVDLEAVRAAMPNNIYWKMSAPTKDPEVLRQRQEERDRWNVEYGKVLSNTATEEEIDAYYASRDRLYSDYIEFVTHILENYGTSLSLQDLGLLKVAAELNLARLEEIPRQIAEAKERRRAHEAAREAWLRDQAAFQATQPAGDPPVN
jgi:hypothetical protein